MKTGIELIADERLRQVTEEGYTADHDALYNVEALAVAAVCYATPRHLRTVRFHDVLKRWIPSLWPWEPKFWKGSALVGDGYSRVRELTKAGALIAAEIDRIQRLAGQQR